MSTNDKSFVEIGASNTSPVTNTSRKEIAAEVYVEVRAGWSEAQVRGVFLTNWRVMARLFLSSLLLKTRHPIARVSAAIFR